MRFFLSGTITVIILNILFVLPVNAQSYGLGFYSHEVVQDKRTTLDLSLSNVSPKENLEISFDLSFMPNHEIYFGYILRIVDDHKQNIDLVYDNQANTRHFKIIIGDRLSKISFNIDDKLLFERWNKLRLLIDYKYDKITIFSGRESFSESGVHLQQSRNYKLLFGANAYRQYQTTDLPPLKLRDVNVTQSGTLLANWPLNEWEGCVANESVNQNNGTITNPLWIKARHRNWQMEKEFTVPGDASIAFDAANEAVNIISQDSLVTFSVNKTPQLKSTAYHSGRQLLVPGDQALFGNDKLYYLYIDQMAVATYDFKTGRWNKGFKSLATNNGHLNKFYNKTDSCIYTIGGYGQLIYKDSVKCYNVVTNSWKKITVKGDTFTPRYLAGLGVNKTGDTAYVIGGYGSASGQQIVNPRNLYDMMRFSVKDKSFKKLFTIDVKDEDFVFANSLVINEKSRSYYGLIFPQHKFNSSIQLIQGSLDKASYHLVGDTIPFLFHDIHSYADLGYFPHSGKFLAVTLFRENDRTRIKIYSLLSPPEPLADKVVEISHVNYFLWIGGLCAAGVVLAFATVSIRRRKKVIPPIPSNVVNDLPVITHYAVPDVAEEGEHLRNSNKNAIFLFGDLQLFTPDGNEITKYFTPLLKELFLVILLYSVKRDRGVSSEKLNEILWFDKSEKSARNNRSVNIAKLKSLLDKMGHCHLSKDTGYWKIEIDYTNILVDYHNYLNIVCNKTRLNKQRIIQLTHITQRGNFLSNIEYEWLDAFKSEVSNEIIDSYIQFANSVQIADDPEFLIKLANDIFYFDPVNEEAMILKCKALAHIGKHSLAKNTFESFNKEYKTIYGEAFDRDFNSILE
ncbi:Kelch repeat-containing protein [Mucilaginibacter ginsenosidivorax]|uniref:Galactose oxidase n=1 Tax=Mucilaginibacter ginsenosidivorax TaxID=862126 RepID=A0A5B8W7N7_9SPHI|nr:galactose oxidase [Mucilaginibacter ginsenosidivorax]QEC80010.1 galactose oxidase [Mucilaginibacter ginsenosidivorax]